MQLQTHRLILKVPDSGDAQILFNYYKKNLPYLKRWFVDQPGNTYELKTLQKFLSLAPKRFDDQIEVKFLIFLKPDNNNLAGEITFSNIIKGGFLSCYTGYHLDENLQGKGMMTEALIAGTDFIFKNIKLHRIEANIMPLNIASQKVALKAGYIKEGISARYLKINGRWEDHLRFVIFNPAME